MVCSDIDLFHLCLSVYLGYVTSLLEDPAQLKSIDDILNSIQLETCSEFSE